MRAHRLLSFILTNCTLVLSQLSHPVLAASSASIAESKRTKVFVDVISVSPTEFEWEGHKVKLHECWLERCSPQVNPLFMNFTFTVDGNLLNEAKIFQKEKLKFAFKHDEKGAPSLETPTDFTTRRGLDYILGNSHGQVVHTMRVVLPAGKRVVLRLITERCSRRNGIFDIKSEATRTLLTFDIPEVI